MKSDEEKDTPTKHLVAQFTKRDLILYALGIGCCDGTLLDEKELQYVYENHIQFQPFPTFLLSLSFVAQTPSNQSFGYGVKPFPPESMSNCLPDGSKCDCIIPCDFFKNIEDMKEVQNNPTLHMSQNLTLHDDIILTKGAVIYPPTQVQLQTRVISVKPRAIGTFVTSETSYYQGTTCIATAQMVALVLNIDPDMILSYNQKQIGDSRIAKHKVISDTSSSDKTSKSEVVKTGNQYQLPNNAALLYRLSGDYNSIHVEGDNFLVSEKEDTRPILHGLCTLGYAVRAVLHHIHQQHLTTDDIEVKVVSVKCNFTKPVFKKDSIHVEVWSNNKIIGERPSINFRVYRMNDDIKNVVVDKGRLQYRMERSRQASSSRL